MTTKLDGALKREVLIGRDAYTLVLSGEGFTLALKAAARAGRSGGRSWSVAKRRSPPP
jgi:hypothetical protein